MIFNIFDVLSEYIYMCFDKLFVGFEVCNGNNFL